MAMLNVKMVLLLIGIVMCALQAANVTPRGVSLGWIGVTLYGLAWVIG